MEVLTSSADSPQSRWHYCSKSGTGEQPGHAGLHFVVVGEGRLVVERMQGYGCGIRCTVGWAEGYRLSCRARYLLRVSCYTYFLHDHFSMLGRPFWARTYTLIPLSTLRRSSHCVFNLELSATDSLPHILLWLTSDSLPHILLWLTSPHRRILL